VAYLEFGWFLLGFNLGKNLKNKLIVSGATGFEEQPR
jgi:hypothetical protein